MMALYTAINLSSSLIGTEATAGFTNGTYPYAGNEAAGDLSLWLAWGITYQGCSQVGKFRPGYGEAPSSSEPT
jgi:hypothetical protein